MLFYQNKKRSLLVLAGMMILIIIMGFTYEYLTRPQPEGDPSINAQGEGQETDLEAISTTKDNAVLSLERFYTKCQHTIEEEMLIDIRYVGKDGTDLDHAYPAWQLVGFTPERVSFVMDIEGYCTNHFIIKEYNDYLAIFQSEKDTGELYPVEVTQIRFERLSQEMQEKVRVGIVVDSIEEIEHLIENLES